MDECRKEFEKWARESGLGFNLSPDVHDGFVYRAWKAYQAAWNRRAPVAQLSDAEIKQIAKDCGYWDGKVDCFALSKAVIARVQPTAGQQSEPSLRDFRRAFDLSGLGNADVIRPEDVLSAMDRFLAKAQPAVANVVNTRDLIAANILKGLVANSERYKYIASLVDSGQITQEQATEKNLSKALRMADQYMQKVNAAMLADVPQDDGPKVSLAILRGISNHLEAIALYFPIGHGYRNTLLWCREELLRLKELQDGINAAIIVTKE